MTKENLLKYFTKFKESESILDGECEWCGESIFLLVSLSDGCLNENVAVLETLWQDQQSWNVRINELIVSELLGHTWAESESEKLTKEQLLNKIGLVNIVIEDSGFSFLYHDGDLYFGHSIQVTGNIKDGPISADAPI